MTSKENQPKDLTSPITARSLPESVTPTEDVDNNPSPLNQDSTWENIMYTLRNSKQMDSSSKLEAIKSSIMDSLKEINRQKRLIHTFEEESTIICSDSNNQFLVYGTKKGGINIKRVDSDTHGSIREVQEITCLRKNSNEDDVSRTNIRDDRDKVVGQFDKVSITQDSKILVASCLDHKMGNIVVWRKDVIDDVFSEFQVIVGAHTDKINDISISKNHSVMVSCGEDSMIKFWKSVGEGTNYKMFDSVSFEYEGKDNVKGKNQISRQRAKLVVLTEDQEYAICACQDFMIRIYKIDLTSQKVSFHSEFKAHTNTILNIKVSKSGHELFSTSLDGTIKVWKRGSQVGSVYFKLDQTLLSTGGGDTTVIGISPGNELLYAGTTSMKLVLWKIDHESEQYELNSITKIHKEGITCIEYFDNSDTIVTGSSDFSLKFWNLKRGMSKLLDLRILATLSNQVSCMTLSPCEVFLVIADIEGGLTILEREGSTSAYEFRQQVDFAHELEIQSVEFSFKGREMATTSRDQLVKLWRYNPASSKFEVLQTLKDHKDSVNVAKYSPDSKILVTGSSDCSVKVWTYDKSPDSYELMQILHDHDGSVYDVNISQDSSQILSCSYDKTIIVWSLNVEGDQYFQFQTLNGHHDKIISLIYIENEKTILSASRDKTIKIWTLNEEGLYVQNGEMQFKYAPIQLRYQVKARNLMVEDIEGDCHLYKRQGHEFIKQSNFKGLNHCRSIENQFHFYVERDSTPKNARERYSGITRYNIIQRYQGPSNFTFSEDSFLFHGIQSLFEGGVAKGVIQKKGLEDLITYLLFQLNANYSQNVKNEILHIIHSRVNILFLALVSGHISSFKRALSAFGYYQYLYVPNFDPLKYALTTGNSSILDEFADYFNYETKNEDIFDDRNKYSKSRIASLTFTEKFILKGLECPSPNFRLFIAQNVFFSPLITSDSISVPDTILTNQSGYFCMVPCQRFLDPDNISKIMTIFHSNPQGSWQQKVNYLRSRCPLDTSFTSPFMRGLLNALSSAEDEILLSDLQYYIRATWNTQRFYILIVSTINWVHSLILFLGIVWMQDSVYYPYLQICYLFVFVLLFCYELKVVATSGFDYFQRFFNILDMYIYGAGFVSMMILIPNNNFIEVDQIFNLFTSSILVGTSVRSLMHLAVFDGVRSLVSTLSLIIFDMFYFLTVLSGAILVIGALNIHANKTVGQFELNLDDYWQNIFRVYKLGYGDWNHPNNFNFNQVIVFIFSSVLLPLIMWNMLIAIISSTFERFESNKIVVNAREIVQMLIDWNHFVSLKCFLSKPSRSTSKVMSREIQSKSNKIMRSKEQENVQRKSIYIETFVQLIVPRSSSFRGKKPLLIIRQQSHDRRNFYFFPGS